TGLGCVEDTEKFLGTIIRNKEEFLTPTSFIQSTHNTVGGQIALGIKCHNYNFTYVHRNVSFEMALIDAIQQIKSGNAEIVLAGAADEITPNSLAILQRLGYYRTKPVLNMNLINAKNRGSIAGEGAAFFTLSTNPGSSPYALLTASDTLFNPPDPTYLHRWISTFLEKHAVDPKTLALLTGHNGDVANDAVYDEILKDNFTDHPILHYKHLCGEFFTAPSFAFWLAASVLSRQVIPDAIVSAGKVNLPLNHILILNHFNRKNFALTLLSQC
ncbi:MAG: hypothetical protein FJY10_05940, partial [Bacteroidetes bacterium]|nr:hypothetical protein [Bacteroidota bacterium]